MTIVNLVAAVPSLHSAFTMLVALFLWPRVRRLLRPFLLLYPLAMGLTLMATGEHYFFDVLLGWIYAGGVMGAWALPAPAQHLETLAGRLVDHLAAGDPVQETAHGVNNDGAREDLIWKR